MVLEHLLTGLRTSGICARSQGIPPKFRSVPVQAFACLASGDTCSVTREPLQSVPLQGVLKHLNIRQIQSTIRKINISICLTFEVLSS